jgi:hypothetical protein
MKSLEPGLHNRRVVEFGQKATAGEAIQFKYFGSLTNLANDRFEVGRLGDKNGHRGFPIAAYQGYCQKLTFAFGSGRSNERRLQISSRQRVRPSNL